MTQISIGQFVSSPFTGGGSAKGRVLPRPGDQAFSFQDAHRAIDSLCNVFERQDRAITILFTVADAWSRRGNEHFNQWQRSV